MTRRLNTAEIKSFLMILGGFCNLHIKFQVQKKLMSKKNGVEPHNNGVMSNKNGDFLCVYNHFLCGIPYNTIFINVNDFLVKM